MSIDSKRNPEPALGLYSRWRGAINKLFVSLLSATLFVAPFPGFGTGAGVASLSNTILAYASSVKQVKQANYAPILSRDRNLMFTQGNALLSYSQPPNQDSQIIRRIDVVVTGYSSTPEQTDDTPFITAQGTAVRDGIVAANFLPFGAKIKMPTIYGDKVFVVEDRMHPRKKYQVDIWFPNTEQAIHFGAVSTYIEVLESPSELAQK